MATIIGTPEVNNSHVKLDFFTNTTSGGAIGKNNIKVMVDCPMTYLLGLAKLEMQRMLNKQCRDDFGTVQAIKGATMQDPFIMNVTGAGARTKMDVKEVLLSMKNNGMTNDEIISALLGNLDDDTDPAPDPMVPEA